MDNKVRRIRVVPPKFTEVRFNDIVESQFGDMAGFIFLCLYKRFGRPDNDMKYIFRYSDVVIEMSFGDDFKAKTYIAPSYRQQAEKKRIKMINIIVRDINSNGVPYVGEDMDKLYYAVGLRNKSLIESSGKTEDELREAFVKEVGDSIKRFDGGLEQYIPEAETVVRNFCSYVYYEGK